MRGGQRSSLIAAASGTIAYLLAAEVVPWVLGLGGVPPREAMGVGLRVIPYVGPFGLLALAGVVGLAQAAHLPGWAGTPLLVVVPAIFNGACYGLLARLVHWARLQARPVFIGLLVCGAVYWGALVMAHLVWG